MNLCEGGERGSCGTELTSSGLLVYRVTVDGGFVALGGVPHYVEGNADTFDVTCWNGWTDSNSTVKRSIFTDDYVYSAALDLIPVAQLDDSEHPVATIPLSGAAAQ